VRAWYGQSADADGNFLKLSSIMGNPTEARKRLFAFLLDPSPKNYSFDIGLNQLDDAGGVEVTVAIGVMDRKSSGCCRTKRR